MCRTRCKPRGKERRSGDSTGRIVRGGLDDDGIRKLQLPAQIVTESPLRGAGCAERRHQVPRQRQAFENLVVPIARSDVQQPRRRSIRRFAGRGATQCVVAEVGDHQQPRRTRRQTSLAVRHELEDGVEREELNARLAKNDFAFHLAQARSSMPAVRGSR